MKMSVFITAIALALVTSSGIAFAQMHGNHHGQSDGSSSSSRMMCDSTMKMNRMSPCCDHMKSGGRCDMIESIGQQGMMGGMNHNMMDSTMNGMGPMNGGMMQMDSMCGSTTGTATEMSCKCRIASAVAPTDRPELR
jgi:hypothetical protein